MIRYAIRRIPSALLVLFLASIVVFALIHLAKGDPAALAAGPDASPAEIAAKRHQLGLDVSPEGVAWGGAVPPRGSGFGGERA